MIKRWIRRKAIQILFGKVTLLELNLLDSIDPKYENLICISKGGLFQIHDLRCNMITLIGDITVSSKPKLEEIFKS